MKPSRNLYPTDVSDDEWAFVAPYLILLPEDAGQRTYSLREVFNGLPSRVPNRLSFGKDATEGESYVFFHVLDSKPRARERAVYL